MGGTTLTQQGDLCYDLAKVFQSLLGYDYMLLDRPMSERSADTLRELKGVFWRFVDTKYPHVKPRDVQMLTAQHYFSIVPLHEDRMRQEGFLKKAQAILTLEGFN